MASYSTNAGRGRGRGRGRGKAPKKGETSVGRNAWHQQNINDLFSSAKPSEAVNPVGVRPILQQRDQNVEGKRQLSAEVRPEQVQKVQKPSRPIIQHVPDGIGDKTEEFEDSSSDEEIDVTVISNIFQAYGNKIGDTSDQSISQSKQNLQEACQTGGNDCSVCLGKVRRTDAIWTCDSCFGSLHLQCIQKWAKEVVLQRSLENDFNSGTPQDASWSCPNCRTQYSSKQHPRSYFCFCKKVEDPPFQAWLAPHSCGQTCGRPLRPDCGHKCLLLCHPGACPPCPQTVRVKCHCGQSSPQLRRCSSQAWSCGKKCSQLLSCGQHRCNQLCHAGECQPCPRTSQQQCLCGKKTVLRSCATPKWQCEEVCGRPLSCGHHKCERVCHDGACGECPRLGARRCPCGKTEMLLPCTEDIPTCGDTCDRPLPCGIHRCTRRCHTGPCETCLQMSRKKCRCGAREKTLPCQEEYKCDHKCTNMRNCQRHQCKRRCCTGDCPSCEQQCNKNLPCGNHKCPSLCHPGRCYPCPLMVEMKCWCGYTKVSVRCGREKTSKPPKCKQLCSIPPDCHHARRDPHLCHFGKCPVCRQQCSKTLTKCGHICPKKCHAAVVHKTIENPGPRAPWKPAPRTVVKVVNEPCPPCEYPIPVQCLGKHEISDLPCAVAAPFSCGRACGRTLACTNHTCQFQCHEVKGSTDSSKAGTNCQECEEGCSKPRPAGCTHKCPLPCHEGPCPECKKSIKQRCHCKAMVLYIECSVWTAASEKDQKQLTSCKGPCPKQLACQHPCSKTCHTGACSDVDSCTFKVSKKCSCKRRKKEFMCHEVRSGRATLQCDDVCKQQKDKKEQDKKEKEKMEQEEEINQQKRDLEEYNRLMNKKKRTRKRREEVMEETFWEKYKKICIIIGGVTVLGVFTAYLLLL